MIWSLKLSVFGFGFDFEIKLSDRFGFEKHKSVYLWHLHLQCQAVSDVSLAEITKWKVISKYYQIIN